MNNFNFMEKLLEGVELKWKPLGEVAENLDSMRKPITSGLRESGEIRYYGASGIVDYVKGYIFDGNFLLVSEDGANLVARSTSIAFSINGRSWVNNHAHVLKFNTYAQRRFVEFYLNNIDLNFYISGAAQPKLNQKNLNSIKIPHPPLNVQAEIVRILDTFTELTARKKQYNYYRDQLFTFEESEVEWKALNEVCSTILAGGDLPEYYIKDQTEPTDEFPYPIYANATGDKGLYDFTNRYKIESDAVTISARGAKFGYHTVREGKLTPIIRLITLVPNKKIILTRYLNYILDMTAMGGADAGIPELTVPNCKENFHLLLNKSASF
ncbi:MAG: restriction endonuclease subunit S [Bacteroidales bacterium]